MKQVFKFIILMDAREKFNALQEQKRKLKAKIQQLNSMDIDRQAKDPDLERLLQKKKALQEQKRKQDEYRKLQQKYNERRKQMQREKELMRVQNEKRVLELQVAMKRVVLEGVKQKVRGMNSEQLMKPNYLLASGSQNGQSSNTNFKDAFEGYLLDEGPAKLVPKYDIKKLNEQRLGIFQKKEEVIMKQLLLKELAASPQPIELEVMSLTRQQLQEELIARDIDFQEFIHVVRKEEIVQNYPTIEKNIKGRIEDKKQQIEIEKAQMAEVERQRRQLRDEVDALPFKDVQLVKRLLYDLFDEICRDYEKRHIPMSAQDKEQRIKSLEKQYQQICDNSLIEQLSNDITDKMLQIIREEMMKDAAEEVSKLHDYAHQKTEDCFRAIFGDGNIFQKIKELDYYKVPLIFVNQDENEVGKPKNDKYIKKMDNQYNVYETEQATTNLINDIALLDLEEKYMEKVNTQLKKDSQFQTEDAYFYFDRELYVITRKSIRSLKDKTIYYTFASELEPIIGVHKIHRNWLIFTAREILLVTPWGHQSLGYELGGRISNPCGSITYSLFYPVLTLLAHPTSALLGFEKGQILKFNFNRNRVTQQQTNITHYLPMIEHAKTGDEPAFPLDNRNYLAIQQQKPKPNDEIHEYREFLQHHSEPIVFIGFYRVDKLISVDRSLKCALWEYSRSRGAGAYEPVFKFQIRSSFQVFKQDENPRYKDIYPSSSSKQTPEAMYKKYMLTQSLLKLQLYNNPKKQIAYFKAPHWEKEEQDKPIWKVTYKESKGQINKILESYYNVTDGKITAQQAQLQGDSIFVLCERDHVIRNDLKTIKIYSWHLQEKRLGKVGLQVDMFRDQKVSNFLILPNYFKGSDLELALIANSGRILLFSLLTGQLLKNINEEIISENNSQVYFRSIVRGPEGGVVYGISTTGVSEFNWEDNNSINDRTKLSKAIDAAKRKYFR